MTLTTSLHKKLTFILSLAVSAFLFIVLTQTSHAATLNVVAGTDAIEENSQCQLSEAIQNINDQAQTNTDCPAGDGTDDTINLPSGTVTLTADLAELNQSVVIQGEGKSSSIIDGNSKQYSGIRLGLQSVPPYIENFELHDASVLHTKNYGIFAYGVITLKLDSVSVSDGESGVVLPGVQNLFVSHTDIDNNIGADNNLGDIGETAGMYVRLMYTGEGLMPSLAVENSSINNNSTSTSADMSFAGLSIGIYCFIPSGCDGDATEVNISNTRVDNNASFVSDEASFSGITLMAAFEQSAANSPPTQLRMYNTSVSENSAESPTGAALSGINLYPLAITEDSWLRNLVIHANTSLTESNQVPSIAGAFGQLLASDLLEVSNITFTENQSQFPEDSFFPIAGLVFGRLDPNTGNISNGTELSNSILASNTKNGDVYNCETSIDIGAGPVDIAISSLGGNISDDASCNSAFTHPTDQTEVAGLADTLGPLSDNGGQVPTIPLLSGSPAIDAGVTVSGLTTDARGVSRPQCSAYDSGAYEYNGTCPTPPSSQPLTGTTSNSTPISLVLPGSATNASLIPIASNTIPTDPSFTYPSGLTSFQFDTEQGATETITLYFDLPGDPQDYTARKYNTTTKAFTTIQGATITRETYNNQSMLKLTYQITDGGDLDQDNTTNGTIVDPVGLAQTKTTAPDTGLQTHWLLNVK